MSQVGLSVLLLLGKVLAAYCRVRRSGAQGLPRARDVAIKGMRREP